MSRLLQAHALRRTPKTLGPYRFVRWRWRVLFGLIDSVGYALFAVARAMQGATTVRSAGFSPSRSALSPGDSNGRKPALPAAAGKPTGPRSPSDPRRILIIQLDHLGDAVLSTGFLAGLRWRFPQASIEVLAAPWNRELFEAMPEVDRVHVSHRNRFAQCGWLGWVCGTVWWGLFLRRRRPDLAIDVRGEFPTALIAWLSGAARRLGWTCGGGGFLLTDSPAWAPDRHEADSRLALLAALGVSEPELARFRQPRFEPSDDARREVRELLSGLPGRGEERPLVVLHVGAGTTAKRWPVEHWRGLVRRLLGTLDAQLVLVGGPGERIIARNILGPHPQPGVADWTDRLDVPLLAALLEQADLVVGADSGPAHLAAAVGTPAVVLFSGTNHARQWQPCGEQVTVLARPVPCSPCHRRECPVGEHPCMAGIEPEEVARAVEAALSRKGVRQ